MSKYFILGICILAVGPTLAQAAIIPLTSTSQIAGPTVAYNTPGANVVAETALYGVNLFVSNSFATASGISGLFTGNANAPIVPPGALSLGATAGPATYFHFSPQSGFNLNAIGLSATSGFTNASTTFRVFAANQALDSLQFDVTMTPTASGIAGLNGGAVFLGVSSTVPLTAFRVWQLDDGFGILDNLRLDVSPVPEPSSLVLAVCGAVGLLMVVRRRLAGALALVVACWAFSLSPVQAVTIPTVPVGNPGNAADTTGYGAVAYGYRIGTFEVTNAQYAEFLNSVATNPDSSNNNYSLFAVAMESDPRGGIDQTVVDVQGTAVLLRYSTKPNMADKPVNFVTWYDAARYVNWLNGTGTENGAYTLLGGTATPSNAGSITRDGAAKWFLPSEDEWYKAAYHDPTLAGGADDYWDYPTRSNIAPTSATAGATGNITNPGANVANYNLGADWNSEDGNVTAVGSAGPLSASYYGTYDQGGNVAEWNEATSSGGLARGLRQGSWMNAAPELASSFGDFGGAASEYPTIGFRVATVPEPASFVLAARGAIGFICVARRRRRRHCLAHCLIVGTAWLAFALPARAVTIPTVSVGNAGNAGDVQSQGTFGAVAYNYRIATHEVTVGQYADFLNAVAATDTYGLYDPNMATALYVAGIARSGASGSFSYSVIGSPNHPITYVSWGDAARFANWLHNGQPTGLQGPGTTETGAYTLNGATTNAALNAVTRNSGAVWFIPSENEWYKAAYHKNDGATGNYWDYPMSTDSEPYSDQPPGATPDNTRVGNFLKEDGLANGYDDGLAVTGTTNFDPSQNYLTDVGAYSLAPGPYGTFDQGGNVAEWNETRFGGGGGAGGTRR
ncbi:MAG: SUMF1/EgtB/PvdO family nonheme iron enzyme [Planctomycetia bacterium]|nr:SUMF1/EgtB/PvdO family nonheme iron enzyme [Planctomycetia bacterium]